MLDKTKIAPRLLERMKKSLNWNGRDDIDPDVLKTEIDLYEFEDNVSKALDENDILAKRKCENAILKIFDEGHSAQRDVFGAIFYHLPDEYKDSFSLPQKVIDEINFNMIHYCSMSIALRMTQRVFNLYVNKYIPDNTFSSILHICSRIGKNVQMMNEAKIIRTEELNSTLKEKLAFIRLLIDPAKVKSKPNQKYFDEMFEYTSKLKFRGEKDFVAYRKTLAKYGFDPMKDDSYRKSYSNYLKQK